jgi:hypothetical protein
MHARYAALLAGLSVLIAGAAALYGHHLEPLTGDLTRIGWYAENDYGWNRPIRRFEPPIAEDGRLERAYDVVALGDSFTVASQPGIAWPHFLARATGLHTGIFDSGLVSTEAILDSETFRGAPPALFVYEVVERQLVASHGATGAATCRARVARPATPLALSPLDVAPRPLARRTRRDWTDWPISYGLEFARVTLLRRLGHDRSTAVGMVMTRQGLFSSRFSEGLLVYAEDFNKIGWDEAGWRRATCDLVALQDRVQANGRTVFVALVAPDKLSVYNRFLPYRSFDRLSRLPLVAEQADLNYVRLDDRLDPTAEIDLYLPNDTHWSPRTHERVAGWILDWLAARGVTSASGVASDRPGPPAAGE